MADSQPFKTNIIQARYYDDQVGYITLQSINEDGQLTKISIKKFMDVGAETIQQDSTRLGLADLIDFSNA